MKICVFNSCDCNYILKKPCYPIMMLKSFRAHFGDELDYILVIGEEMTKGISDLIPDWIQVRRQNLRDTFSAYESRTSQWPQSCNWCTHAPKILSDYDFAIYCDGDILCHQKFNISDVIPTNEDVTVAHYTPMGSKRKGWQKLPYANSGFQIINVKRWCNKRIWREYQKLQTKGWYNGDQDGLNHLIRCGMLKAKFVSKWYNFRLPDTNKSNNEKEYSLNHIFIAHFIFSKPHNLNSKFRNSRGIKRVLAKEFLTYS